MTARVAKSDKPTLAELEKAEVHDARALLAGDDDCRCRTCQKVDRYFREKTEGRSA